MTNREEFCALRYGTFYDSISDSAIIRQQHEKIRTWVQSNIPSRLYRYRAVNEHTFDALRKDEIWGSSIFSFNDPFECMPHYDPERAKELLKREMDIGRIAEKYRAYKNGDSVPALQSIFSEEQLQWLFSVLPEDIQPEALENPFSLFRENALRLLECCQDEFEKVFYRTLIDEQKQRSIACFTESNDNSAMWGHYADSHRGFCIEYDFQKILTACSEKCADIQHCTSLMMSPAIAPVIYADVRYDASQIILPLLLSRMADLAHTAIKPFYEDLLVIVKSLLTKSSVWSYENEWRMISMLPDNTLFCRIYSLKPTAVYIGARTDLCLLAQGAQSVKSLAEFRRARLCDPHGSPLRHSRCGRRLKRRHRRLFLTLRHRAKHFTSCKCGICVPAAHKLCAQQDANLFKRKTSEAFSV